MKYYVAVQHLEVFFPAFRIFYPLRQAQTRSDERVISKDIIVFFIL